MWGRVADLFSPKSVFVLGFGMMGVFSLLCSFMTNQYAYYIMRAITGIFAAATVGVEAELWLLVLDAMHTEPRVDPFGIPPDHGCL